MTQGLLTICGSFHGGSANRAALEVATAHLRGAPQVELRDASGIDGIPALDPTLFDDPPDAVVAFRAEVDRASGVLVAAPEYAGGLAGGTKNALDWCVGSGGFYRKPVVAMSAGTTGGRHALRQLVQTLLWQGAHVVGQLGIAAPKTKSDPEGRLVDEATLRAIRALASALVESLAWPKDARARQTRRIAAELGILDYPHMPA